MLRIIGYVVLALAVFAGGCSRDPVAQGKRLVESGKRFYDKGKYKEASIMFRRALQKDPKNGDAYYHLGLTDLKLADFPDAIRAFQRAISTQQNNTDALVKIGDIYWAAYLRQRKPEYLNEVQSSSEALLKKDPKSFDGLRLAGFVDIGNNNLPAAMQKFETANSIKPYDPVLTSIYAQSLAETGKPDQAEKLLKELIARQKNFASAYQQLFRMYMVQKRLPDAENILKLMAGNLPHAEMPLVLLSFFYAANNRRPDMEAALQKIVSNPKDFPMGRYTVGGFFVRMQDLERARHEFEEGAKANPKDKGVYQKAIVEVLAMQGKNNEASQLIAEVLKDDPKDSQAVAMRSALLLTTGSAENIKLASADLQKLVAQNPRNAVFRYQYARALAAANNLDQARVQLEEALQLQQNLIPARVLLAQVYAAKRDPARALATADEVLKDDQRNYRARLVRSGALTALGRKDEARAELQQLLKMVPNSPDAKFQLGFLSFQDKDYKGAEQLFQELHEAVPGDPRGLIGIVEAEVAQKNHQNAINLLQAAIDKDPGRNDYRMALGNILVRDGQFDRAIKVFQEVAAKQPKSDEAWFKLGETYRLKGDINSAIEMLRKAKALAGGGDTRAALRLAMLLDGLGRRNEAKPAYEEVLRITPDEPVALNNLAYLKAEEGSDLDTAMSYAQRARSRYPQDPNIADTLGWIYIKKNLSDEAVRIYREITARDPNNATYRYHLAMALFQKGDRQNARKELETAMKSSPSPADQQRIKDLLVKVGS